MSRGDEIEAPQAATSFSDVEPIFVVGAPRSGTTLLQLILNAHPRIAIHGEIHYFSLVLQLQRPIPDLASRERLDAFFENLDRASSFQYLPNVAKRLPIVKLQLQRAPHPSYALFYRLMMEEYAAETGARRWGEKTPQNIRYLKELTEIFPRAKIVHIVRDPRDVVASLIKMPWASDSVGINAIKWKIDMLFIREFLQTGGAVHEMRYEDLVSKPEEVLAELCEFIGEEFDIAMLDFDRTATENIRDEPWKKGTSRRLNAGAVNRWKSDLAPAEVEFLDLLTTPFLQQYGYQADSRAWRRMFSLPCAALVDLVKYARYRRREKRRRREEVRDMIFGEEAKLRAKLLEALLTRRL